MIKKPTDLKFYRALLSSLLFLLLCFPAFAQQYSAPFRLKTIVIDAGHGGKDPGARGSYSFEKDVALSIAKKTEALLHEAMPQINVIMTRSTDKFIPLNERSQIANNNKANLFISIHCNSSPEGASGTSTRGVMLLVYGFHRTEEQREALRENSSIYIEKDYKKNYDGYSEDDPTSLIVLNTVMAKYRKQSIMFGELLDKEFVDEGRRNRGVKEQGVLVLAHSAMPAVLIETGYINNATEEAYLNSREGQEAIASAIVRAIKLYQEKLATD
jgi:N-acetylmuramoyl-L-alanine amidase